jgi:tetratricopeptide (TPR) repeat protein
VLFHTRLLQGQTEEMIEPLAQAAAENPAIDLLRVAVASAYCSVGRLEEAAPLFEHDAATGFTDISRGQTWTTAMGHAAESAIALGRRDAAAKLYDLLIPYGDMVIFNSGMCEGALARSLGCLAHLLDRLDQAETHFRSALFINQKLKAPYWTALTQLDFADLLRDTQKIDEATGFANQALQAAKQFSFTALENRAKGS